MTWPSMSGLLPWGTSCRCFCLVPCGGEIKAGSGREGEISSRHPYKQLLALLCFPASCSGRMYPNFALLVLPEPSPVDFNSGTCAQSFLSLMHSKGDASAKCLTRIACMWEEKLKTYQVKHLSFRVSFWTLGNTLPTVILSLLLPPWHFIRDLVDLLGQKKGWEVEWSISLDY